MGAPSVPKPVFIEYSAEVILQSSISVEETIQRDGTICIGVDLTVQDNQCLLCYWSCSFRGNLYKHLKSTHGFTAKCCVLPRSPSNLKPEIKGCRKTYPEETFDLHTCSD